MRETGALWEIKPEGSEILGQAQALGYVTELGSANVAAHLGNKIGDDALGASGSLDYLIYRVSFSASEPGLITYRVAIRPELNLFETRNFGAYEPGPLVDSSEVNGLILMSQEFQPSSEQHFHCYLLPDCLSDASPRGAIHETLRDWLVASLSDEWRFLCMLGGTSGLGFDKRDPSLARSYLEAACHHWPAMAAQKQRFGPMLQGRDILDHWSTLFVALNILGISARERMAMTTREPQGFLELIDSRRVLS